MKKILFILWLFPFMCFGQLIVQGEFFFDIDLGYGLGQKMNIPAGNQVNLVENIDIKSIKPGFHTLYFRLKDDSNGWGQTFSKNIFVSTPVQQITKSEYFIDLDPGYGQGIELFAGNSDSIAINHVISLEDITPGYHVLYYRSEDKGSWGQTFKQPFYKTLTAKLKSVLYSFDDLEAVNILNLKNAVWDLSQNFDVDISSLSEGNHTIHLWVLNSDNQKSEIWNESFYTSPSGIENIDTSSLIEIYPNPASELIKFKSDVEVQSVTLISLNGKIVSSYSGNLKEINVKDITNGYYLLSIKKDGGIQVLPIVINH